MIKTEYKRDMGRNYLIFQEEIKLTEGYFLKLLQNSSIEGILPLEIKMIDEERECYWDITGKQSLKMIFERGGVDKELLKEVLEKILKVIKRGEAYLLRPEDYILTSETIFLDISDFSLYLCYIPGYQKPMNEKWKEFTEYLMNAVNYKEEDMVLFIYGLYKAARRPEGFEGAFFAMEQGLPEERPEPYKPGRQPETEIKMSEFEERIEEDRIEEFYPKKIYFFAVGIIFAAFLATMGILFLWRPGRIQAGAVVFFGGAVVLYSLGRLFSYENKEERIEHQIEFIPAETEENTVILASEIPEKNCYLRAEDNRRYKDIELIEFPFFFGKLQTQVNSLIESPAVSRFHAKMEYLGGEYYLVDLNSTNGTYLNGERLMAHERRRVEPEDRVQFADVGYYFEV